jgi:ribosomal protein S6
MVLTEQLMKQQGVTTSRFTPLGKNNLAKAVSLLAFGGYVSWYMAAARNVKPGLIPTVDWLKVKLNQSR